MYHISMSCVQVYIGRMVAFFCVGVFFALIYVKARARTQEYALQRLWMMMCGVCEGVCVWCVKVCEGVCGV